MIVMMKPSATSREIEAMTQEAEHRGCRVHLNKANTGYVLGLTGNIREMDSGRIEKNENVERVVEVKEPYLKANRIFHAEDTVVRVGEQCMGGNKLAIIAGPCAVESVENFLEVAELAKEAGAGFLRGGAFKPRTSPYSFQGLGEAGLEILCLAREKTGLPVVSEVMAPGQVETFLRYDIDVLQIGSRNMQNFDLLKEVGRTRKPVLLKRGLCSTMEEFLMAAEYVMSEGNENVVLCERGIRTFEKYTRNTLDLSAVPVIKKLSHLPIIIDPSHAGGHWRLVEPLAKAAVAAGADGVMIEVHQDPTHAVSDGPQSLKPEKFAVLVQNLKMIAKAVGKEV